MRRHTKIIISILLLTLFIGAFRFYNIQELKLIDMIPAEVWKYQIFVNKDGEGSEDEEVDEQNLAAILEAVKATTVTRGAKWEYVSDHAYFLYLYPYEGYPTLFIVSSDGRISVAENLDIDNYRYFEDGWELYAALEDILNKK